MLEAFALVWPNDPNPLLYTREDRAEEDRKWFAKNFKLTRDGKPRGEPVVVRLVPHAGEAAEGIHSDKEGEHG